MRPVADWTLTELLERTANDEPTPSAGSVAAVSAALAMGLVAMGFQIAAKWHRQGKPVPRAPDAEKLAALIRQARELAQRLFQCADDDQEAVRRYLRARRSSETEGARQALADATEAPLAAARAIREGLSLAEAASQVAPPPVAADVAAGTVLLQATLRASLGAVEANIALMPSDARRAALAQEAARLSLPPATP